MRFLWNGCRPVISNSALMYKSISLICENDAPGREGRGRGRGRGGNGFMLDFFPNTKLLFFVANSSNFKTVFHQNIHHVALSYFLPLLISSLFVLQRNKAKSPGTLVSPRSQNFAISQEATNFFIRSSNRLSF